MKKIIIITLIIGLYQGSGMANSLKNSRPNIIFVMTDDQGMGDLSCMGNKILKTPHLDAFYKKSTRLTDYHVSPTCAPTRASIMSGKHEFRVGVTHTILQRERMALDIFTLPQALQSANYETGIFGKWHLGDENEYLPQNRGFDEVFIHGAGGIGQALGDFKVNRENKYFDNVLLHNETVVQTKGFCTDVFFKAALAWSKKQLDQKKNFFTYLSLNAPHGPFIAPEKYSKRFSDQGYDEKVAGRYGMIENIDDNFGILMRKLEEWGALENTMVIFTTDNGMSLSRVVKNGKVATAFNAGMKGGKNSPYEGGNHVPFFCYWKGVLAEGRDIDQLTAHVDLYHTFCELAGVKLPKDMQKLEGRSFLPLLENNNATWEDRTLFVHRGRWDTGKMEESKYTAFAVRTEEWRFENKTELYNINNDPGEQENLIDKHPEIVNKLLPLFEAWWNESKPYMINENAGKPTGEKPFDVRYKAQEKKGIPLWDAIIE